MRWMAGIGRERNGRLSGEVTRKPTFEWALHGRARAITAALLDDKGAELPPCLQAYAISAASAAELEKTVEYRRASGQ